jgi:formyl-CoA transferase
VNDIDSRGNGAERLDGALEGIRVLDLTHQIAGPAITMAMAILGAEVIKVERPGSMESQEFPFFLANVSKRSVTLDLKSERGVELALRLAEHCDVFVENFRPGVIERLGLGYETVAAVNSRLIYAQLRGFGRGSFYADYTCYDPIAQAMSGAFSITGEPDGRPIKPGPDTADTGTGMVAALTILAALIHRERTGAGQRIEIAMTDHVATFMRLHYAWPIVRGVPTPRTGNAAPFVRRVAPADTYRCHPLGPNDYVYIHCGTNGHWHDLLGVMGRMDLAENPRLQSPEDRGEHHEEVDAIVESWCAERTKLDVMRLLGEAGVPVGAVRTTEEVLLDPDLMERGIFTEIEHPDLGVIRAPGWAAQMSGSAVRVRTPPLPGADNESVFGELLGLTPDELASEAAVVG